MAFDYWWQFNQIVLKQKKRSEQPGRFVQKLDHKLDHCLKTFCFRRWIKNFYSEAFILFINNAFPFISFSCYISYVHNK